jgi:uracil-DNA glycosylase family protein
MFVGEQPGDSEDQQGSPFVGPAGRLLAEVFEAAKIEREEVYLTNAVKHFKWTPSGKRRLHAKPNSRELKACRPWLEAEIEVIKPVLIVCLGATAAQSLLGRGFRITQERGKIVKSSEGSNLMATYHPSAILRAPDRSAREEMRAQLFEDLKHAKKFLSRFRKS